MKGVGGFVKFVPHLQPEPLLEFLWSFSLSFFFVAKEKIQTKILRLKDEVCSAR